MKKSRQVYDESLSGGGLIKSKRENEKVEAVPHSIQTSPTKKVATKDNVRSSQVMSQTNYGSPAHKSNHKSKRE
jgi:hypothetical protein